MSYRLLVKRSGMPPAQWKGMFNDLQGVRIIDANGHTFSGGGGGSMGDEECETSNNISTSEEIKGPLKLVWEMTTQTQEQSIPFEFHDLPLPTP